ncbi:MAG: M15 family metallopeptidase [Flavobacteriaceae bacterium]|nr:M15 family metallopeptidase [Flavobacteriaceae bacterium]
MLKQGGLIKNTGVGLCVLSLCLMGWMNQPYSTDVLLGKTTGYNTSTGLTPEADSAFIAMKNKAAEDGIILQIVSGFRSYERQKSIWNTKFNTYANSLDNTSEIIDKITEYSSFPGTSRHHWGTDVDLIDTSKPTPKHLLVAQNYSETGVYCDLFYWMQLYAKDFGFYLVYDAHTERKGFNYEPWHYSYLPTAKPMLKEYLSNISISTLKNPLIEGSQELTEDWFSEYLNRFMLGINQVLKE